MTELAQGVSWAGVIAGFVLSFLLGWLWYSPKLFGTAWAAGVGVDMQAAKQIPKLAMSTQALGTFMLSWLIGITAVREALLTAVLIVAMLMLLIVSNGKYAQKSNTAVTIEAAYILTMGVVMVVCQAVF